jgi:hypothetical protein
MLVARSRLARDLANLGLEAGGVAMVHCRMSALGRVVGGAETVVRALLDALGPDGTLMAYTGWQDQPPDVGGVPGREAELKRNGLTGAVQTGNTVSQHALLDRRDKLKEIRGNQLYFYYRAGERLGTRLG